MMLKVGDVLNLEPGSNKRARIVWITADGTSVAIYPLDTEKAFPKLVPAEPLEAGLRVQEVALVEDPFMDRPGFRRHLVAIIHGNKRGVYEQQQAVHG